MARWIIYILFGVAVGFAGSGHAEDLRVVTGNPSVSCAENEILVSIVCAKGAPDGSKCPSEAVGLCAARENAFTTGVRQLYKELLDRDADAAGLKYYSDLAARSGSIEPVRAAILASEEYRSKRK